MQKKAPKPRLAVACLLSLLLLVGAAVPAWLALLATADTSVQGPRRVGDILDGFAQRGFRLDTETDGRIRAPRVFLPRLPKDWRAIVRSDQRKRAFVMVMLPLVLQANDRILAERERLRDLAARAAKKKGLSPEDEAWLEALAGRYRLVSDQPKSLLKDLLVRVDIVPPSLAIAQAAIESGWGSSRFAIEGNALFGQWTSEGEDGLVPAARDPGQSHVIRRFDSLLDSVSSYLRNLNTHGAYREFRAQRAVLRAAGKPLDGTELAAYLEPYSERGADYVDAVQRIIDRNGLKPLDSARLHDGAQRTLVGALPED